MTMSELEVMLQAVNEAGQAILKLQQSGFTIDHKANNDLVTEADLLANEIITNRVAKAFPADGWLSEETADNLERLNKQRVWILDPIDGTIEFAKGVPEYGISLALVENGEPILAAVFNPATAELFHAIKDQGAWLNGERIYCNQTTTDKPILLASRSEYKRGEWAQFEAAHKVKQVGSIAYKLALVASGKAHATWSLGPKNEWDIAAGVLLVAEAGGIVSDKNKQAFRFNQQNVLVNGVVASSALSFIPFSLL